MCVTFCCEWREERFRLWPRTDKTCHASANMPVPHPRSRTVRPGPTSSRSSAWSITEAAKWGLVGYCSSATLFWVCLFLRRRDKLVTEPGTGRY
jgi:hypothetical protein